MPDQNSSRDRNKDAMLVLVLIGGAMGIASCGYAVAGMIEFIQTRRWHDFPLISLPLTATFLYVAGKGLHHGIERAQTPESTGGNDHPQP